MTTTDALLQRVTEAFDRSFGGKPALVAQAPGRVNLIGEHTDYNDGFVLPCAIGFRTLVAIRPRRDAVVNVVAADFGGQTDTFRVDAPIARMESPPAPSWPNYVRGVFAMLAERGVVLQGADLAITGDVPSGAGLSSSASLEVALGTAITRVQGDTTLSLTDIALVGQRAEHTYAGCLCGNMDQLASAHGVQGHALLIDCRSLEVTPVRVPDDMAIVIVHSNVKRGLVDSQYNARRAQCDAAVRHLGVKALRDATFDQLEVARATMDPLAYRRARHIVTENDRTLAAAQALREGNLETMGRLMAASHASMRDDFEITVPAVDQLADILQDAVGAQGGTRMTGGGFGGCVVALMPQGRVDAACDAVARRYRSPDGAQGTVFVSKPASGAGAMQVLTGFA